ncbi:MAG TPA: serine/threonine-protein kinase [Kofleriaceae bacterium]
MDLDGLGWTACLRCLYEASEALPEIPGVELEGELARGGMGVVYRGRHRIGRPVAVKVIHDELADEPSLRARFAREARLLARLSHPGIVTIHDWGDDPLHYIVMELVEGTPIEACDVARACELVGQLCDAIAAVHAAGIVHRDLKPSNVLVCDGQVKLIDFGIAAPIETAAPLTRTGQQLGTPEYMAPEARTAGGAVPADPAIDVYGIARLLRTITVGTLPSRIERVVKRALAEDPYARPALGELRAVLAMRSTTRRTSIALATCAASLAIAMKLADSSSAAVPMTVDPVDQVEPRTLVRTKPHPVSDRAAPVRSATVHVETAIAPRADAAPVGNEPVRPASVRPASVRIEPVVLEPATLAVRVVPWAMVSIDGGAPRRIEPPVERIEIPPGRHVVELANPVSGRSERRVVELAPGEVSSLTSDLLGAR